MPARDARRVRVGVIGGGAAGIATAVGLKKAGFSEFTVFEQSEGPGGVWWDNVYPGCEVDIHSYFYSFSFMTWDWTRTYARQPELRAYLQATIDRFGIGPHFRHGCRVDSVTWDDARDLYVLRLSNGEVHEFEAIVSGLGFLSNPRYPTWPGMDEFDGEMFHTARWRDDVDLAGKRVALVGTGSTSLQIAPAIAADVEKLYVFQREPGWVIPKAARDFTPQERERFRRSRWARKRERFRQFRNANRLVKGLWIEGSTLNTRYREQSLRYIESTIEDEDVRRAVTPTFAFGCKRSLQTSDFYPTLNRPNVTLIPRAVDHLTPTDVVTANESLPVDVVILATGFQAQRYQSTLVVRGRGGRDLQEYWDETPMAFVGSAVPGFPNFFMVYGPNTNGGGSGFFQIEAGAALAVRMIRRLRGGARRVEVTERAYLAYNAWLDRVIRRKLTAQTQCNNYYFSPSGRNVNQWPGSHLLFKVLTTLLPMRGMRSAGRRRG